MAVFPIGIPVNPFRKFGCFLTFRTEVVMASTGNIRSLCSHEVIGFDMDHTLVRYKLPAIRTLVQKCLSTSLIESNKAPSSILDDARALDFLVMKGVVCDKRRGNLLKLSADSNIIMAYHGSRSLSESEITTEYGSGVRIDCVKADLCAGQRSEHYFFFDNYFDSPAIPILAALIDWTDAKLEHKWEPGAKERDYSDIWTPLIEAFNTTFRCGAFKEGTGGFFPTLQKDPEPYVRQVTPGARRWLAELRRQGSQLFVLTSSHSDFAHFLLDYSYGPSWREDFAVVGVNARKPGFFAEPPSSRPFFSLNDHFEKVECSVSDLKQNMVFAQGNCAGLNEFFARLTGKESPKVAYFGDSIRSDVLCLNKGNWDPVAIVEELFVESPSNIPPRVHVSNSVQNGNGCSSPPLAKRAKMEEKSINGTDVDADFDTLRSSAWGSFFAHDGGADTLCANMLQERAYACVPCLPEVAASHENSSSGEHTG
ncbi:5'-nucleotidase domain-containing protein 1-like [Sycon ciliatum]|uniref:5'-nucleotidase domain-containing protein 1-like n=1 Tax=Sycon ciliatum TaxID=27933 RepID=UPI0031F71947